MPELVGLFGPSETGAENNALSTILVGTPTDGGIDTPVAVLHTPDDSWFGVLRDNPREVGGKTVYESTDEGAIVHELEDGT